MSAAPKRRVLLAGLVVFTLWPCVQLELVRRYDVSPWKLAGWGMYAAPRLGAVIDVLGRRTGEVTWTPVPGVSRPVIIEADRFLRRWHWLRRLGPPTTLGRLLLAEFPHYAAIEIRVRQRVIDRETGMVVEAPYRFTYER